MENDKRVKFPLSSIPNGQGDLEQAKKDQRENTIGCVFGFVLAPATFFGLRALAPELFSDAPSLKAGAAGVTGLAIGFVLGYIALPNLITQIDRIKNR